MNTIESITYSAILPPPQEGIRSSVKELLLLTSDEWAARDTTRFNQKLELYARDFVPKSPKNNAPGFLEKHDVEPGTEIAVIGDIHANDRRLEVTLQDLQKKEFLDNDFKCLPNRQIVFLGDFADRGNDSLKVLELVVSLKMENPHQVHLIRGNHEETYINHKYQGDQKFENYLSDPCNEVTLNEFYERLPVAVYIGQNNEPGKRKEYMMFSHALFYAYTDPAPLFLDPTSDVRYWAEKNKRFSDRIMQQDTPKLQAARLRIQELITRITERVDKVRFSDCYWIDVETPDATRTFATLQEIKAYLKVTSTPNCKVKELVRGHQWKDLWALDDEKGHTLVTTIDPAGNQFWQVFMVLKVSEKVRDWEKSSVYLEL